MLTTVEAKPIECWWITWSRMVKLMHSMPGRLPMLKMLKTHCLLYLFHCNELLTKLIYVWMLASHGLIIIGLVGSTWRVEIFRDGFTGTSIWAMTKFRSIEPVIAMAFRWSLGGTGYIHLELAFLWWPRYEAGAQEQLNLRHWNQLQSCWQTPIRRHVTLR